MKMWTAALAALALAACSKPAEAPGTPAPEAQLPVNVPTGDYTLDPNHSTVTVSVRRFGISNYILRFNAVAGTLHFNADAPAQSSVEATVDVTSLDTPYAGDRDFDAELQNSSWLDSAAFPQAIFHSTSIESTGPNTARMTGDLMLHGVTHPVTCDVTYNGSHSPHPVGMQISSIGFSAVGTIQRSQFGVNEMMPSSPGAADGNSNDVKITIEALFSQPITDSPTPDRPTAEPVN